jgi:peptidyl-prolyl cis-trans isomerase B (cyclophilin B)
VPTTKQRRLSARRRLDRQLARRAQMARRRRVRYQLIAAGCAVVVVLGAVWLIASRVHQAPPGAAVGPTGEATPSAGPTAAPIPTATFAKARRAAAKSAGPCRYAETAQTVSSPYTRDVGLPPDPARTPKTGSVPFTLTTNQGTITIALDRAKAPCTVQSFVYLASKKFLDGTHCHRLTTSQTLKVLQCGDPSGTGQGGPTYQVRDEGLAGATYKRGTVAMANAGPNTNGSQFFLVFGDSQLAPKYTPIGTVSSGLPVLDKIGKAGSDSSNGPDDGRPVLGVTITTARVGAT